MNILTMKGRGSETYYVLTSPESLPDKEGAYLVNLPDKEEAYLESLPDKGLNALLKAFPNAPEGLKRQISELGKRTLNIKEFKDLIKILCSLGPLKRSELANILDRKPKHLGDEYLSKMIKSGELVYLYPEQPIHPKQAYLTPKGEKS